MVVAYETVTGSTDAVGWLLTYWGGLGYEPTYWSRRGSKGIG
jgi:hypothetical protein